MFSVVFYSAFWRGAMGGYKIAMSIKEQLSCKLKLKYEATNALRSESE